MSETYLQMAVREFRRLQLLAERAMSQISDEQFFAAPAPGDNSIAVIVKHVGGNLVSRWTDFLTSDGEKPGRNRDEEFRLGAEDTRERLLELWARGWAALFTALEPLGEPDLARLTTIRGEPHSVLQAVNRQLTHYAYYVGQIVFLANHHCGSEWRSLSIPLGHSAEFNRAPARYITMPGATPGLLSLFALLVVAGPVSRSHASSTLASATSSAYASWRSDQKQFLERMARVEKGWTEKQVLEWLDAPREKSGDHWFYKWMETGSLGGLYEIFIFKFKGGVVAEIEHTGGCETVQRRS